MYGIKLAQSLKQKDKNLEPLKDLACCSKKDKNPYIYTVAGPAPIFRQSLSLSCPRILFPQASSFSLFCFPHLGRQPGWEGAQVFGVEL